MKVLYILENYWPHLGGMETLMEQLCNRMVARNHDVTVLTRSLPNALRRETRHGVKISRVPSAFGRFFFPIAAFQSAVKFARECDVIHTTTFSAAPLGSLVALLTRKPVILTVPELWIGKWHAYSDVSVVKAALFDFLERLIFALPYDAYVGISDFTTGRLQAHLARRSKMIRRIYCGFDPSPWTGSVDINSVRTKIGVSSDEFLVVSYGRPGMSKGFRYLVDAFPAILQLIPNVRMHLIISDSLATATELGKLKQRADPRIVFRPPLPFKALTEIVRAADCVVVPSLAEGFGYAVLEAGSAGVPLVVSETSSIPEVVGGRYQFATPRNVKSIARAIEQIARGEFIERELPRFDWEDSVADYSALYESVVFPSHPT